MYIDRILYPVTALGPGNRIAIWTVGCSRRCPGCANPELWERYPQQKIAPQRLAEYINKLSDRGIDGITISGGEPFDQAEEIKELLDLLKVKPEVLVFSGYSIEELQGDVSKKELLEKIDVLIDGAYVEVLNDGVSALRGSTNQQIHYLREDIKEKYAEYIKQGRQIQNFVYDYKTISVGIHNPTIG